MVSASAPQTPLGDLLVMLQGPMWQRRQQTPLVPKRQRWPCSSARLNAVLAPCCSARSRTSIEAWSVTRSAAARGFLFAGMGLLGARVEL